MKNNFDYLIDQFKSAKGLKHVDIYSKKFISEFAFWLKEMQKKGEEYINYLDILEFNFKDSSCAEFGKGEHDTLVKPFKTKIISPNAGEITGVSKDRLIIGNVKIYNGNACLLNKEKEVKVLPKAITHTYMTQNPYYFGNISGFENIHNCGNNNIIIGVYGNIHDKDRETKENQIKTIKNNLNKPYIEFYETDKDSYYHVIGSKRKIRN